MLLLENTDALTLLRSLPDNSVDCMVNSPPYLAQRRYSADGYLWEEVTYFPMSGMPAITIPEWRGEMGLEATVEAYIGHLVIIYREAKRVLKPTGNFWLNIGDKHGRGTRSLWEGDADRKSGKQKRVVKAGGYAKSPAVLKEKSLTLVPQRILLALEADGWYVRVDCIWNKLNALPGSQEDRFTINHEYVFHLTKQAQYWFDMQAVAEPVAESTPARMDRGVNVKLSGGDFSSKYASAQPEHGGESHRKDYQTRSKRSVLTLPTSPSAYDYCRCGRLYLGSERSKIRENRINPENGELEEVMLPCLECGKDDQYAAHYAAFPAALIEPLILAGCPPYCCADCGTPYKRIVKRVNSRKETNSHANDGTHNKEPYQSNNPHRMRLYENQDGNVYADYGGKRKRASAPGSEITSKTSVFTTGKVALKQTVDFPPTDRPQRRRAEELFVEHGLTQDHLDAIVAVGIADTGKSLVTSNGAGKNSEEVQRLADEAKAALGGYYREFCYNNRRETLGWQKMCKCETDETIAGTVLDMFSGSGTSAMTAISLNRNFIGSEINPDYWGLSLARIDRWREDPQFRQENSYATLEQIEHSPVMGSSKPIPINLFGED